MPIHIFVDNHRKK